MVQGLTVLQVCARKVLMVASSVNIAGVIEWAARSVRSVAVAMPTHDEMRRELRDVMSAQQRGYFLPDEDERIRDVFVRYLSVRSTLLEVSEVIQRLPSDFGQANDDEQDWEASLKTFVVGFVAAAMLMRAASFLVELAAKRSVVRKKLDEAQPGFGIPEKSFTMVYKNLGSSRQMWRFHEAVRFYDLHREEIALLANDPVVGELIDALNDEAHFLDSNKRDYIRLKLGYRLYSIRRRHVSGYKKVMFQLLKLSGSMIAEMTQPFVKRAGEGKRVTPEVLVTIKPLLRAGDVMITRHDDAMSNLFLPGFWPHAALYMGGEDELRELELPGNRRLQSCCFLEAKKDGVLLRPIEETLHVDAFLVLRPKLDWPHRAEALARALTHEGKLYDFMFDFRKADRLACTEVIYRSYHGIGDEAKPITFELKRHTGRPCISAEDLIEQALGAGDFEKVADFGVEGDNVRIF